MTVDNITKLAGRCYQLEQKLAELEEKLNSHIEAMSELRLNHRMIQIEERLDKLSDDLADHVWDGSVAQGVLDNEERLDKLETATLGNFNDIRKLEKHTHTVRLADPQEYAAIKTELPDLPSAQKE